MIKIAGSERTPPRTEPSAMYWNVLESTAHRSPESPVPSSKAPGTTPSKTAGRPLLAASQSQSAPVTRGTKDEKDHHCDVMDSRTALEPRCHRGCSAPAAVRPSTNPSPACGGYDRSILDRDTPCSEAGRLSICSNAES